MTREDVQAWLDRYVRAWETYDPSKIGELFSDDAEYRYHPGTIRSLAARQSWRRG